MRRLSVSISRALVPCQLISVLSPLVVPFSCVLTDFSYTHASRYMSVSAHTHIAFFVLMEDVTPCKAFSPQALSCMAGVCAQLPIEHTLVLTVAICSVVQILSSNKAKQPSSS